MFEDRLFALQGALKDLVAHIHSLNMQLIPSATSIIDSSAPDRNDSTMSCPDSFRDVVTIRETMDLSHAERVCLKANNRFCVYTVIVKCCLSDTYVWKCYAIQFFFVVNLFDFSSHVV